jgi:hypothetical protein
MEYLELPVTSSLLHTNILISHPALEYPNLCPSPVVRDQVHTHTKELKLQFCVLHYLRLYTQDKTTDSELNGSKHYLNFMCS